MDEIEVKVKQETTLCAGCLSVGRNVSTLKAHCELYLNLLGQYAGLVSEDAVSLCWECSAVLRRIWKFRQQVQAAQVALQQALNPEDEKLQSLSTLVTTKFDVITCLPESPEKNILNLPLYDVPIVDVPKVEYEEIANEGIDENNEGIESFEPIESCKEESLEETAEKSENLRFVEVNDTVTPKKDQKRQIGDKTNSSKRKKNKLKFSEYLEITKNHNIDLDNCDQFFTDSTLTDEEAAHGGIIRVNDKAKNIYKCCKLCRIPFLSSMDYHRHLTFCHLLKVNSKGPYRCLECQKNCEDQHTLRSHWATHNNIMRCIMCKQAVDSSEAMHKHLKSHTRVYTCTACPMQGRRVTFHAYRDFFYHCRDLHTKYLCDHCDTVRRSKHTLVNHMRKFHDPIVLARKEARELRYCVECDIEFRSVKAYRNHLHSSKLHNPEPAKRGHPTPRNCGNKNINDRNNIIALHEQGLNMSEIARELSMSRGTVRHWVRRYTKEGSLTDRPRGRPSWRRVSPDQVQQMVRHLEQFPNTSTKTFAQQYKCSTRTIRTLLHKAGCGHYLKNPAQKKRKT